MRIKTLRKLSKEPNVELDELKSSVKALCEQRQENHKKVMNRTLAAGLAGLTAFGASMLLWHNLGAIKSQQNEIYAEARSTITAVAPFAKEFMKQKIEADQDVYPNDPRVMSIAGALSLQGVELKDAQSYLDEVSTEAYLDSKAQVFFKTMAAYGNPLAMVQRTGDTEITLFDKWIIDFESPDSVLLEQFPRNPTLVMNHESVAFPDCVEGAEPFVAYAKATKRGVKWEGEPAIAKDVDLGRWIFTYPDLDPLDKAAFDRRILAVPNCRPIKSDNESDTQTEE